MVLDLMRVLDCGGGLDLLHPMSSDVDGTVSHQRGVHTEIVLFPTLVRKTPPRPGGGLRPFFFFWREAHSEGW